MSPRSLGNEETLNFQRLTYLRKCKHQLAFSAEFVEDIQRQHTNCKH